MSNELTKDEKRRAGRVAFTGALLAAVMCLMVTGLLDSVSSVRIFTPTGLAFVLPAALATFISVRLCWRLMLRKTETRGRGARYGALAGLLAVFLMCAITMLTSGIYSMLFTNTPSYQNLFDFLASWLFVTLGFFYYALIFGGLLAIPFGAIAGFMLTKDSQV